jgi:hypothetical protein
LPQSINQSLALTLNSAAAKTKEDDHDVPNVNQRAIDIVGTVVINTTLSADIGGVQSGRLEFCCGN